MDWWFCFVIFVTGIIALAITVGDLVNRLVSDYKCYGELTYYNVLNRLKEAAWLFVVSFFVVALIAAFGVLIAFAAFKVFGVI